MSKKAYRRTIVILITLIVICLFILPFTSSKYIKTINNPVTLNIVAPKYTVIFNANSGAGTMSDQEFEYGTAQNLTQNSFTKTGYTFAGWNTEANGSGTAYTDTQSVNNLSSQDGAIINLYAQWNPITYIVHFDANSGTGTMADQTLTYDVQDSLTSNAFTKAGYLFNGWNTAADGSGTPYTNTQQVSNLTTTNGDTITLYAQWEVEDTSLTVTLNKNINPIATEFLTIFGFQTQFPTGGYKVLGITIQNNHSYAVNNWTVEFNSDHQVVDPRPADDELNAYLNSENYYGTVLQSGQAVTVRGNDTLAPGETKTVYVFFDCTYNWLGQPNNNHTFTNERAYYTPNNGRRNAPAKKAMKMTSTLKKNDEIILDNFGIYLAYDTIVEADNSYSTTMYVYLANNTGNDISNIKFDVSFNDTNLSKLSSNTIQITSNTEKGASLQSNETIQNQNYKVYEVTGLKTSGGFNGMNISNIEFEK